MKSSPLSKCQKKRGKSSSSPQKIEKVEPVLKNPYLVGAHSDSKPLLCWIAQRVVEMGWTKERFGSFDNDKHYPWGDRSSHKAERVGKKYQWIAFHEIAARMADNFYLKGEPSYLEERELSIFDGPWQPPLRDIDPSIILRGTKGDSDSNSWWASAPYTEWYGIEDSKQWLQMESDLPSVEPLIEVTNPTDGQKWLSLDFTIQRHEPESPGAERLSRAERGFRLILKSYLIHHNDKEKFWNWAVQQNFMQYWMPESSELREVFWGELFGRHHLWRKIRLTMVALAGFCQRMKMMMNEV